jgi:hypothetical protein
MSELRPWSNFDRLVDELAALQSRARDAAARSVDEILTLRSWLIGVWIVAFEQDGADRARYGDDLLNALAAAFKRRGVAGLGASNLKNFRQLALTWPRLGIRQTASGESAPALPAMIRQTVSAGLLPSLPARSETLPWQDDAWHERLRRELSFSHLLELSRVQEPLARAFYEVQVLAHRWSVRELKRQRDSMLFERIGLSKDLDEKRRMNIPSLKLAKLKPLRTLLSRWFGPQPEVGTTHAGTEEPSDIPAFLIVHPVVETEAHPVPYDENLLERARIQRQFGDWQSLARLERAS